MSYTNKNTVMYNKKKIDLRETTQDELKVIRTRLSFDLFDIEEQISWAKSNLVTKGVKYNSDWMLSALAAAKIKRGDIAKIDRVVGGKEYFVSNHEKNLRELLSTVDDYMKGLLAPVMLDDLIEKLQKEYKQ